MATKLTRDQKMNLGSRITRLSQERWTLSDREDTPKVVVARKVVQAFDSKSEEIGDRKKAILDAECNKANELLYFGTPDQALTLVKKLEKKYATLK